MQLVLGGQGACTRTHHNLAGASSGGGQRMLAAPAPWRWGGRTPRRARGSERPSYFASGSPLHASASASAWMALLMAFGVYRAGVGLMAARMSSRSDDSGLTFGPAKFVPGLPSPHDHGSILTGHAREPNAVPPLYFSGPYSKTSRSNMSIVASFDDGASWVSDPPSFFLRVRLKIIRNSRITNQYR